MTALSSAMTWQVTDRDKAMEPYSLKASYSYIRSGGRSPISGTAARGGSRSTLAPEEPLACDDCPVGKRLQALRLSGVSSTAWDQEDSEASAARIAVFAMTGSRGRGGWGAGS
jgi:hypothetical protein